MSQSNKIIFVLTLALASCIHGASKKCAEVKCMDPPSDLECTKASEKNKKAPTVETPKGEPAECCPVWQCTDKSKKSTKPEFYTFHGMMSETMDTEIVRYSSTLSGKDNQKIFNVVSSKATGNHDAEAFASDTDMSKADIMKEIQASLTSFGLNF